MQWIVKEVENMSLEWNQAGIDMLERQKKMKERREYLVQKIEGEVGRLSGLTLLPTGTLERLYELLVEVNE